MRNLVIYQHKGHPWPLTHSFFCYLYPKTSWQGFQVWTWNTPPKKLGQGKAAPRKPYPWSSHLIPLEEFTIFANCVAQIPKLTRASAQCFSRAKAVPTSSIIPGGIRSQQQHRQQGA